MIRAPHPALLFGGVLALAACGGLADVQSSPTSTLEMEPPMDEGYRGAEADAAPIQANEDKSGQAFGGAANQALALYESLKASSGEVAANQPRLSPEPASAPATTVRRWFPEAFLWQPLVETGAEGRSTLDVTVPDQLTTWRVLALAHDRQGQQAGTIETFDTRLPLYVDPVVPGWLYSGDRLRLPVQAVNSTSDVVAAAILVEATGAVSGQGRARVTLPPGGTDVRTIPLAVTGSGAATIRATLTSDTAIDGAERIVPVQPSGRPVTQRRGSTLSSTRTLSMPPPMGADGATEILQVLVFPGPLAVLQAEVDRLASGARPRDGAYGFSLAAHLTDLAVHAGTTVDEAVLRQLQIVAWQRIVRDTRAPSGAMAADLLTALAPVDGHALVNGVRPRLVQRVVDDQRADGTWSRDTASTLQRVLVDTATAARSLPEDTTGPRLRARGAVERLAGQIDDGYTASVVLAADLATGAQAADLLGQVEALVAAAPAGHRPLDVPDDVRNPWGIAPGRSEILAMAALALPDGHPERTDLVGELMGRWSAGHGFGAGPADAIVLSAIAAALPGTPEAADVVLSLDGVEVDRGSLDPTQPRISAVLEAAPAGEDAEIEVRVTPEVPGLSFVATRRSWVPWSGGGGLPGVEVEVDVRGMAVGRAGTLTVSASAPSDARLVIEQGLPSQAIVEPSATSIVAQAGGTLEVFPDRIRLTTRPFRAGEIFVVDLPVSPAFSGRFTTAPLQVSIDAGAPADLEPAVWIVSGAGS